MREVILNVEPFGFSARAVEGWKKLGTYTAGSWQDVESGKAVDVSVLIVRLARFVGKPLLEKLPSLKYIVTATTGLDHLDAEEIKARKIKVLSLRGEDDFLRTIPSTAEHTWALLMALVRKIPQACHDVQTGHWQRDKFRGHQLQGKTLGIIGLGRTGTQVAQFAAAFKMPVKYHDPYAHFSGLEKVDSLVELVASCDIISLHVHLSDETRNLMNSSVWQQVKPGLFFINTSRGGLVDEVSLVEALKDGRVAGVASDVLATEQHNFKDSYLYTAFLSGQNVILTPHLGGATWEAMNTCEEFMVSEFQNIQHL